MDKKIKAFTLAEVLVTLAIIGVVAVLTVANLIKSYQKNVTVSKIKEAYSVLSQTFYASELQNGSVASWDVTGYIQWDVSSENLAKSIDNIAEMYFVPYMKAMQSGSGTLEKWGYKNGIKYAEGTELYSPTENVYCIELQNGMFIILNGDLREYAHSPKNKLYVGLLIYVDLDGPNSGANTIGKDFFVFQKQFSNDLKFSQLTMYGTYTSRNSGKNTTVITYLPMSSEQLTQMCHGYGTTCGALIMRDGWKISDDYPWL